MSTLTIKPLTNNSGLPTSVQGSTWTPVEASLRTDFVFKWTGVSGKGSISYFEIAENIVPKWFGVIVPDGLTSFDKAHIYFHPHPNQGGYADATYQGTGNWTGLFHYLASDMAKQFCAAGKDRVLVMPLLTLGASDTCGKFPQEWETIISRIFGMLKSKDMTAAAPTTAISSVVVSSFSSGISYSHFFRKNANLGTRLAGVIDFDGALTTSAQYSGMISRPAGRIIQMQQMPASEKEIKQLAARNIFPLRKARWGTHPFTFPDDEKQARGMIHSKIPQTMMFIAAGLAG